MAISFTDRLCVPAEVLVSGLQGESVILNVESERYFGLDDVGTRMMSVLTTSDSIQQAYETLLAEYDVDEETLRRDLTTIVEQLLAQGLVTISHEQKP